MNGENITETFKDIYTKHNKGDTDEFTLDTINLNVAAVSCKHIDALKNDFKRTKVEFINILNLSDKPIEYFLADIWAQKIYPLANALIQKANAIKNAVNLHNMLFPDEKVTGFTEYELELVNELKGK